MHTARDLTLITMATGPYLKWLPGWSRAVCALHTKPAEALVITSVGARVHVVDPVLAQLRLAGIAVRHVQVRHHNLGRALNEVMPRTTTPLIMVQGVDDVLLPTAVDDTLRAFNGGADIVALGHTKDGQTHLYDGWHGLQGFPHTFPPSGAWPFRKHLWERRPFRAELPRGWDSASLSEWCSLGARVVGTSRAGYVYTQHDGSLSHRRINGSAYERQFVRQHCLDLRQYYGVSIVVPLAAKQDPTRVRAWEWLRTQLEREYPDWEIVTGTCTSNTWVKRLAVEDALSRATGQLLVILDADCWPTPDALRTAVARVREGLSPWAITHNHVRRLTERATEEVLAGELSEDCEYELARKHVGVPGGGCLVLWRSQYQVVGGFPHVEGWGFEDEALGLVLDKLAGRHYNANGILWHLWHTPQPVSYGYADRAREVLYRLERKEPDKLLGYVQQWGVRPLRFA